MRPLVVLVAGGGVAGIEAVLALRHLAGDRVHLVLTTPGPDLVRRQEAVGTPFTGVGSPRVPLERVAALGVDLRHDAIAGVDTDRREVRTTDGAVLRYDRLLIATGAHPVDTVPGALHFAGPLSAGRVEGRIAAARQPEAQPLTFVVPAAATWALPAYELALQAAAALAKPVRVVTPEPRPLDVFGPRVSDAVARLLDAADVEVLTGTSADAVLEGHLVVDGGTLLPTGDVIALPALEGPRFPGLGFDRHGFLAADVFGRLPGVPEVFAAGDVTASPVKQGGLATQQADAAAAQIAAEAGAPVTPAPATRILRAALMTGERPLYLRGAPDQPGDVSRSPLWEPPGKLAGRFLSWFVAAGEPARELTDLHHSTRDAKISA